MNSHTPTLVVSTALAVNLAGAASNEDLCADWLAHLQSDDEKVRSEAWFNAGRMGATGVPRLAPLITHSNVETGRAATRALAQIVRYAGRPGAHKDRKAVVKALLPLLDAQQAAAVRIAAMRGLAEIAGDEAVKPIAARLTEPDLRETARMALERLPGPKSLAALNQALAHVPEDFKPNLAQSIRARGGEAPGIPDAKLMPCKATQVQPVSAANKN